MQHWAIVNQVIGLPVDVFVAILFAQTEPLVVVLKLLNKKKICQKSEVKSLFSAQNRRTWLAGWVFV